MFEHLQYLQSFETVGLIFVSPINQHPNGDLQRSGTRRICSSCLAFSSFIKGFWEDKWSSTRPTAILQKQKNSQLPDFLRGSFLHSLRQSTKTQSTKMCPVWQGKYVMLVWAGLGWYGTCLISLFPISANKRYKFCLVALNQHPFIEPHML